MSKSRNWVFTKQATEAESEQWNTANAVIPEPFKWHTDSRVKYVKYQIERAPETGKLHVQGMIIIKSATKMTTVKNLIGDNPHVEICKDVAKSVQYCGKAESRIFGPWEHGDLPKQGKRTDLVQLWSDVKSHKRTRDMLEEDPRVAKFEKQIKFMRFNVMDAESDRQMQGVKVYVFYGDTDLGKTYTAMNLMDDKNNVFKMDPPASKGQNLWWDAYEGERTLVLDEFEGENYCSLNKLKVLLDKYKCRLDVKGAFTWAAWTTVIICSNTAPRNWYQVLPSDETRYLGPLKRRIYQIRHFVARGFYVIEDWDGKILSDQMEVEAPLSEKVTPVMLDDDDIIPSVPLADVQPKQVTTTAAAITIADSDDEETQLFSQQSNK